MNKRQARKTDMISEMEKPGQGYMNKTRHIVLINPNTSTATTAMMTDIARQALPDHVSIAGVTARTGVPMILDEMQLAAAAAGVIEMGLAASPVAHGIIVSAFGDPGVEQLRRLLDIPVIGICEASMIEAAAGGRRFGIATVTPQLVPSFSGKAEALGLGHLFAGTRLTDGDLRMVMSDAAELRDRLAIAVEQLFKHDGAEAVIIGGGPLGQAAIQLQQCFAAPVIAPIDAAARFLTHQMENVRSSIETHQV
jgi:allantoin racemase